MTQKRTVAIKSESLHKIYKISARRARSLIIFRAYAFIYYGSNFRERSEQELYLQALGADLQGFSPIYSPIGRSTGHRPIYKTLNT